MTVKVVFAHQFKNLPTVNSPEIAVGVFDGQEPDGTTVAEVALWNHEGTDTIPARPFIRIGLRSDKVKNTIEKALRAVLDGRVTAARAAELVGLQGRNEVVREISQGIDPPNAPSTIARKRSNKPLIDTGILRSKITYKVR